MRRRPSVGERSAVTRRARAGQPWSVAEQALDLSGHDEVRIVAVADTHSAPHDGALVHIAHAKPHAILHGGDIGDLEVLDRLGEIAPVFAVRGNIDGRGPGLPDGMELSVSLAGGLRLAILLVHIAVYGPKLRAEVVARATSMGAELVVCGHSHVPFVGRDRGFVVFNPGSIGPRRFQLPIVFGLIHTVKGSLVLEHRCAETGDVWVPGRPAAGSGKG